MLFLAQDVTGRAGPDTLTAIWWHILSEALLGLQDLAFLAKSSGEAMLRRL